MAGLVPPWQRWNKKQRVVALVAISLGVVWIVYLVVLRPLHQQVVKLHHDVHDAEQRLLEAVVASQQAKVVNKAFAAYAPYVTVSDSQESARAGFVSEVESALRQSSVAVLSLNQVTPREHTSETINVAIEAESSPGQLVQFLDLIQHSPRLLKVVELAVRVSESKTLRSSLVISKLIVK